MLQLQHSLPDRLPAWPRGSVPGTVFLPGKRRIRQHAGPGNNRKKTCNQLHATALWHGLDYLVQRLLLKVKPGKFQGKKWCFFTWQIFTCDFDSGQNLV